MPQVNVNVTSERILFRNEPEDFATSESTAQ